MASTRRISCASACARRSVDVSTSTLRTAEAIGEAEPAEPPISIRIDGRVRRSRGSVERHTAQSQPIIGTPCDVPVPSSVILRLNDALAAALGLDESEAKLVENFFEQLPLIVRQVAARFLVEQLEDLDHLRGAVEVRFAGGSGDGVGQVAEVYCRRARQGN